MRSLASTTILIATFLGSAASAQDTSTGGPLFAGVTVFGDSITDSGNIPAFSGNFDETPSPPYFNGRFSNGPVFVELFPAQLGVSAANVRNFAIGGATFGDITISAVLGDNPAIADRGVASQVRDFVATGARLGRLDLVQLNAGNNDFGATLLTNPPDTWDTAMIAAADTAGADFGRSVRALQGIGASQFLVQTTLSVQGIPNFADPQILAADAVYIPRLNANLVAEMNTAARPGDIFYVMDTRTMVLDVVANPGKYGFTDVTTPCLDDFAGTVCTDDATRLWWDGQHPTRRAHQLLAAAAADTLIAPRTLSAQGESVSAATGAALRRAAGPAAGWRLDDRSALTVSIAGEGISRPTQPFAIGFDETSTAFGVGYRLRVSDAWSLAAGLDVSNGDVTLDGQVDGRPLGAFTRNGVRVSLTAQGSLGPLAIDAATVGGGDRLSDIRRTTGVAGQIARGDTRATSWGSSLHLSYPVKLGTGSGVAPFVGVRTTSARVKGYREQGALGLDQDIQTSTRDTTQLELGVYASTQIDAVLLDGSVAWNTDLDETDPLVRTSLVTVPGVVRTLPGAERDSDHASVSMGLAVPVGDHAALSLRGSGDFGDDRDDWSAMLSLTYRP
jgi:outer membrane lipase/esterase